MGSTLLAGLLLAVGMAKAPLTAEHPSSYCLSKCRVQLGPYYTRIYVTHTIYWTKCIVGRNIDKLLSTKPPFSGLSGTWGWPLS